MSAQLEQNIELKVSDFEKMISSFENKTWAGQRYI